MQGYEHKNHILEYEIVVLTIYIIPWEKSTRNVEEHI